MVDSVLTPLQLSAGAGLLQNQGLGVAPEFTQAANAYTSQPLIQQLLATLALGSTKLQPATQAALENMGSTICPALSDAVPSGYPSIPVTAAGFIATLISAANTYMGNGDISKFAQALAIAQSYVYPTNQFINSAVNSQTYLANTFTNMSDMITGDITKVSVLPQAWGTDLLALGSLINLSTLNDLGSPLNLMQRIVSQIGVAPVISKTFTDEGISSEVIVSMAYPRYTTSDTVQKLMYQAMTKITGDSLKQILKALRVTTPNIETMADLLNPVKIFPNSYHTFRVPTLGTSTRIYLPDSQAVNRSLVELLPPYVMDSAL